MPSSTPFPASVSVRGESSDGDVVAKMLDELGALLPEFAQDVAHRQRVEAALRKEFGGQKVYISSALRREDAIREICSRFNGRNASSLAREYGIPRASVYRYLKQAGK